ncbi:hypothetical protein GF373_09775 [bacterium]|nr:hypothetical protein [bacterium]
MRKKDLENSDRLLNTNRQPEEWERLLKEVTVQQNPYEMVVDPHRLARFHQTSMNEIWQDPDREEWDRHMLEQINMVRKVMDRKLSGKIKQCLEIVLSTGTGPNRIARILRISPETARNYIKRGIEAIRSCLTEQQAWGRFPSAEGTRPTVRVSILPLDTEQERAQFQQFANEHPIVHVSYRGEEMFREVLVIYLTGKSKKPFAK